MAAKSKRPFGLLGSLQLACILLLCLFFLTAAGTWYQVDHNIIDTKKMFFNSWFLTRGGIPYFPGGMLCMTLLTVNMIVGGLFGLRLDKKAYFAVSLHVALVLVIAMLTGGYGSDGLSPLTACVALIGGLVALHLVKFGIKSKRQAVAIVHVGIIVMLGSGMVKILTAVEGHLSLFEGETGSQYHSLSNWEVAIWEEGGTEEIVIGDDFISDLSGDASRTFTSPKLPFTLELAGYVENCQVNRSQSFGGSANGYDGFAILPIPNNSVDGVNNTAGIYAKVNDQKAILWALSYQKSQVAEGDKWVWFREPWTVKADGRTFLVDFRRERYTMPFEIKLMDAVRDDHGGMGMAKSYHSDVERIEDGIANPVRIEMNRPLRSGNLVLFQSGLNETARGTNSIFTVVENISDKWPEYSLWVVTLGMAMAFGRMLLKHVISQLAKNALRTEA
ncbi:MAG: hypothetical protein ACJAZ8_000329 [Planctomycetota bacterium]|jgi:hypothetical protein